MLAVIADKLGKHTKIADVHGGDIAELHRKITETGRPVRANRILTACSKMFSLALVPRAGETLPWRNAVQGNPCKGIKKNYEEGRERFSANPNWRQSVRRSLSILASPQTACGSSCLPAVGQPKP